EMRRIDARPGIAHGHKDACPVLLGADQDFSSPFLYRACCLSRIQDEVQQDLLQLNAISLNEKQSVRKLRLDRDAIPKDHALRQYDHFVDCRVEIKTLLSWRRFLHLLTNAVDDFSSSICVPNDAGERLSDLAQVRRLHLEKILGRLSVVARAGDRLRDLVRER